MSTTINQYLLLGVRMRLIAATHEGNAEGIQEQYADNGYKKEIGHFEGMTLILDGLDGKDAFFGIVKKKALADDWLGTVSIERIKPKEARLVLEKAQALFGSEFTGTAGWHVVTYYH